MSSINEWFLFGLLRAHLDYLKGMPLRLAAPNSRIFIEILYVWQIILHFLLRRTVEHTDVNKHLAVRSDKTSATVFHFVVQMFKYIFE